MAAAALSVTVDTWDTLRGENPKVLGVTPQRGDDSVSPKLRRDVISPENDDLRSRRQEPARDAEIKFYCHTGLAAT